MLRDLHVQDLAVVASAALDFGPGLNVLTGETGAGKSLVVDSLALLAGARASSELIRKGAEELTVGGVFEPEGEGWSQPLAAAGLDEPGGELVIRRQISRSGRNRVFVDDRPVTLGLLAELAPGLLRIHTQREELGLFTPELQRRWLDRSGGESGGELARRVERRFAEYAARRERLERARGDERLRAERADLLRFQAGEIEAAALVAGEERALDSERRVLRHSEAIGEALAASHDSLIEEEGSASDRISRAARAVGSIAEWEPEADAWAAELEELGIRVGELGRGLRARLERVEADPGRLNEIEERLATIDRLRRKYGKSSEEILAYRQAIGHELEDLEADDDRRRELQEAAARALERYREAALDLSAARVRWGERLAGSIHAELADLAMGKARFAVRLERRAAAGSELEIDGRGVEFGHSGLDLVRFELRSNPGEESKPLARVASGGELSRVYLALRLAVQAAEGGGRPTLVFDEVDAGLGGAEGAALGQKLRRLSRDGQILAVTHLPQVASFADRHFRVHKAYVQRRTVMRVERLDREGRVEELARMLAGEKVTATARSHAEELLAAAGGAG